MRYFSVLFLMCFTLKSLATNYYVSPSGSNSNNGLTEDTAFQTLEYAANQTLPGDTVFAMNGTYTNSWPASGVLNIDTSGTADNRIVYKNYPGHTPLIKLNANNWAGIGINGADYITIDGFTIVGNNDSITLAYALAEQSNTNNPATSGNGIGITRAYNDITNKPHHNIIRNCTISKCGGAGIYGYRSDYTTIENNTIFECAWYAPYGNSAISLYQCWNSDALAITKNYIVGNTCYRNENYIPFIAVGSITDGNGIIIDDGRNTQNSSTQGVYLGKTYIANNLIYDNGGRGIHVYLSDNVTIANNTCFQNCQSPAIQDGEYTAYSAGSISFINNIAFPSAGIPPIDKSNTTTTNLLVDHNLWAANADLANPLGTNAIIGNPDFVNPSANPLIADFHLQASSNAINAGTAMNAPLQDKDNNTRLPGIDIGCYEYQLPLTTAGDEWSNDAVMIYPSPASNTITIETNPNENKELEIYIANANGQTMLRTRKLSSNGVIQLDIEKLAIGIYFISIIDYKNNALTTKKIIKAD